MPAVRVMTWEVMVGGCWAECWMWAWRKGRVLLCGTWQRSFAWCFSPRLCSSGLVSHWLAYACLLSHCMKNTRQDVLKECASTDSEASADVRWLLISQLCKMIHQFQALMANSYELKVSKRSVALFMTTQVSSLKRALIAWKRLIDDPSFYAITPACCENNICE